MFVLSLASEDESQRDLSVILAFTLPGFFGGWEGQQKNPWTIIVSIWEVSRLSQLLGTHENLKQRTGRQELGQLTYGINVFQRLEDGGEFNNVRHGVLTLKHVMHFRLFVICLFIVSVASAVEVTKLHLLKPFSVCSVQCRLQTSVFMEFSLDFKSLYIYGVINSGISSFIYSSLFQYLILKQLLYSRITPELSWLQKVIEESFMRHTDIVVCPG